MIFFHKQSKYNLGGMGGDVAGWRAVGGGGGGGGGRWVEG